MELCVKEYIDMFTLLRWNSQVFAYLVEQISGINPSLGGSHPITEIKSMRSLTTYLYWDL